MVGGISNSGSGIGPTKALFYTKNTVLTSYLGNQFPPVAQNKYKNVFTTQLD